VEQVREKTTNCEENRLSVASGSASHGIPNFGWIRTAAQAAVALQLHGVLENTGHPSVSARLQHASLPVFVGRASRWVEELNDEAEISSLASMVGPVVNDVRTEGMNFEDGVQQVQSELHSNDKSGDNDEGYDLLPLPIPAPERRFLTAGSEATANYNSSREARFYYGSGYRDNLRLGFEDDSHRVYLGEMAVDQNIDKLREVIGSVDITLSKSLATCAGIGQARRERLNLQVELLKDLDGIEGMRGRFISQRALLKGVIGLEQCRDVFGESDLALVDGKCQRST
jgi:hypothetical protein